MSLEEDFKTAYIEAIARLNAKDDEAEKLIREIEAICEETGIPYRASVSPLSQVYRPKSFDSKWPTVNDEIISATSKYSGKQYDTSVWDETTGGSSQGEYAGWQHSAVCY